MGLLTDPSAGQGKLVKALLKHYSKLCVLLYLGGIIWFCSIAHPAINSKTYFSENALLPGLVKSHFYEDEMISMFYNELSDEMTKYDDSIPYPWLLAKFKQIGLDSYTHNFTLHSPLAKKEKYSGKNIYGILRAARSSSTEAIILSAPYRPPVSVHPTTAPSIAVMLAFAKYANTKKYWAKDIIFLITEHEQLGIQAWLEAYHGVSCGHENILDHGDLRGRAGAIQAAVNLELHSQEIGQIDLKIEGLNGQLPNLDLFNLVSKMCGKEGVYQTFKNVIRRSYDEPTAIDDIFPKDTSMEKWSYYFRNLLAMTATQATGIPNGNHGLFHRFGIQALTLEGFQESVAGKGAKKGLVNIGRIIEGTFRSLNNLLERFHQSFFFYLLPSSDRYISIGIYMPAISVIVGALFVNCCAKWFKFQEDANEDTPGDKVETQAPAEVIRFDIIITVFLVAHLLGIILLNLPQYLSIICDEYNCNVNNTVFYTLSGLCGIFLLFPFFVPFQKCEKSMSVLNILSMLELGTVLICVSMNNISLGMFCGALSVPFALLVNPSSCRYYPIIQRFLWFLIHPLLVLIAVVLINTYVMFPEEEPKELIARGLEATQHAVIYSIADSMIYGNWLFSIITSIFIPNWLCFWCVAFSTIEKPKNVLADNKKTN